MLGGPPPRPCSRGLGPPRPLPSRSPGSGGWTPGDPRRAPAKPTGCGRSDATERDSRLFQSNRLAGSPPTGRLSPALTSHGEEEPQADWGGHAGPLRALLSARDAGALPDAGPTCHPRREGFPGPPARWPRPVSRRACWHGGRGRGSEAQSCCLPSAEPVSASGPSCRARTVPCAARDGRGSQSAPTPWSTGRPARASGLARDSSRRRSGELAAGLPFPGWHAVTRGGEAPARTGSGTRRPARGARSPAAEPHLGKQDVLPTSHHGPLKSQADVRLSH